MGHPATVTGTELTANIYLKNQKPKEFPLAGWSRCLCLSLASRVEMGKAPWASGYWCQSEVFQGPSPWGTRYRESFLGFLKTALGGKRPGRRAGGRADRQTHTHNTHSEGTCSVSIFEYKNKHP